MTLIPGLTWYLFPITQFKTNNLKKKCPSHWFLMFEYFSVFLHIITWSFLTQLRGSPWRSGSGRRCWGGFRTSEAPSRPSCWPWWCRRCGRGTPRSQLQRRGGRGIRGQRRGAGRSQGLSDETWSSQWGDHRSGGRWRLFAFTKYKIVYVCTSVRTRSWWAL